MGEYISEAAFTDSEIGDSWKKRMDQAMEKKHQVLRGNRRPKWSVEVYLRIKTPTSHLFAAIPDIKS